MGLAHAQGDAQTHKLQAYLTSKRFASTGPLSARGDGSPDGFAITGPFSPPLGEPSADGGNSILPPSSALEEGWPSITGEGERQRQK